MSLGLGDVKGVGVHLLAGTMAWALLAPQLHTDFVTCVLATRRKQTGRGKPIQLPAERLAALNTALLTQPFPLPGSRPTGTSHVESLAHLESLARLLYAQEQQMESDGTSVGGYYDARAHEYDQHNKFSQERLTFRVLELAGWFQPATTVQTQVRLLLDVGSGTGLSSAAARSLIAQHGSGSQVAVVGCDASLGMLAERRGKDRDEGACAADIGSGRLPFRGSCFDGAFSVSAIHYLCHDLPKLGITGRQRAEHLFREVLRVLSSDSSNSVGRVVFCAQFFPEEPAHARLLLEAALAAGWGEHRSALVVDQTHHTEANVGT